MWLAGSNYRQLAEYNSKNIPRELTRQACLAAFVEEQGESRLLHREPKALRCIVEIFQAVCRHHSRGNARSPSCAGAFAGDPLVTVQQKHRELLPTCSATDAHICQANLSEKATGMMLSARARGACLVGVPRASRYFWMRRWTRRARCWEPIARYIGNATGNSGWQLAVDDEICRPWHTMKTLPRVVRLLCHFVSF